MRFSNKFRDRGIFQLSNFVLYRPWHKPAQQPKQHNSEILTAGGRLQTAGLAGVGVEELVSGALEKVSVAISGIRHTCNRTKMGREPAQLAGSTTAQSLLPNIYPHILLTHYKLF